MTQPGSYGYGAPLDPITRLVRDVEDLKRRMRELAAALGPFAFQDGLLVIGDPAGKRIELSSSGTSGTEEIRFFYDSSDTVGVPIVSGSFGNAWDVLIQGKDNTASGVTTSVQAGIQGSSFVIQNAASSGGPGPSLTVSNTGLNPGGSVQMNGLTIGLDATESIEATAPIIIDSQAGDPVFGGALYAKAGALYWKGTAGTVTKIANA